MNTYTRHELGQNFLADPHLIAEVQRLVRTETSGPIIELGAGDGALTRPLARLGRPVTALEIDPRRARRLAVHLRAGSADTGARIEVICADILRHRFPATPHTIVGNIPFHLTTAIIRRLLAEHAWTYAVLIVQWEVARRRAGVGGASMLTASWWPWYDFQLIRRIPATSFRPVPSVDAGLMTMHRRPVPLVTGRRDYQSFVQDVFQSRGRNLAEMIMHTGRVRRSDLHAWLRRNRIPVRALPKDLTAQHWAELWSLTGPVPAPNEGTAIAAATVTRSDVRGQRHRGPRFRALRGRQAPAYTARGGGPKTADGLDPCSTTPVRPAGGRGSGALCVAAHGPSAGEVTSTEPLVARRMRIDGFGEPASDL